MNFLNRFSHLEDNDYYECNDDINSFKPTMKKTSNFKANATVQTPEFKLTQELFPSLTKSVKTVPVPASLSFSKIISTHEKENIEDPPMKEEQPNNMREGCFVGVFNKKTRVLSLPTVVVANNEVHLTAEESQVVEEANEVLNELNELHIRRSKEYLSTWGEDEYIQTFLSKRDVESAPIFLKTS